jgi:hypothetical protein
MTTDEIIAREIERGNDAAADAAYELWKGDRKPEIVENLGDDRDAHPAHLVLDGIKVPLTGYDLDRLANQASFILLDHIERKGADPLRQSELVDTEDMDEAFNNQGEAQPPTK